MPSFLKPSEALAKAALGPRSIRTVLLALAIFCSAPAALAQFPSPINNDTRTPVPGSGHDYINMLSETVDPSNGSLSVHISTPVPPSRGITIPFSFDYSSGAVKQAQVCQTNAQGVTYGCWATPSIVGGVALTSLGWSYRIPELTATQEKVTCHMFGTGTGTTDVFFNYIFTDPSGTRHNLGMAHTASLIPNCSYVPEQPYSVSTGADDFYQATLNQTTGTVTVVSADGTVYNFPTAFAGGFGVSAYLPSTIEDRNGNVATISQGSGGSITVTDTAGRPAFSTSAPVGQNGTVSISGLSQGYTVTWETVSSSYGSQYQQLANGLNDGCAWSGDGNDINNSVIESIKLPNGELYTFGYDSHGLVNQISYPTGALVNYTWNTTTSPTGQITFPDKYNNLAGCDFAYYTPMIMQRTVKFDGVHTALVQNFSYTTAYNAGVEQATVLTTVYSSDGSTNLGTSKTVYNYFAALLSPSDPDDWVVVATPIPVEQTVQYYDYGQTNLLETVTKGWQDQFLLGCQLDTHDGSGLKGTFYSYGAGGVMTDKKEYDYGQITGTSECPQPPEGGPITAPSSPAPLRETVATYQSFTDTPIYPSGPSIFDRPATIKTYLNGATSGTLMAETDYSYDYGTVGSVSNLPTGTHDETNYGPAKTPPRGNATTAVRKCLQSAPACPNGNPTTTYTYDETGQALTMVDPCGNTTCSDMPSGASHTTTYSYADSHNTNAYVTTITYPPTSGGNHTVNFSYGYADGQLTKSTDQNNQPTTYAYNTPPSGCSDGLDRLGSITYPDTGLTTYCYNDTAPAPTVTTQKLISSGNYLTTVATTDGLGHVTETLLKSDPDCSSGDRTDTTYDGLGHVYTVSNPYCSTSDPTYGITKYTYDGLGRTTQVQNPDTSTVTTSYTGRATEVTDESGKQRISQVDGLGRLTAVCEVTSTNLMVGIAGSTNYAACGLDIAANGFSTTYLYDVLDDLTNVTQGPLNPRTFAYNSLGQLTSATNPESGTICYGTVSGTACQQNGYDANGNLIYKTDARSDTITYAYDADNRVTGKTYSDTTPAVTYNYDESSSHSTTLTNTIGRKSSESTAGTYLTASVFSYDQMGRVLNNSQCVGTQCGSPPQSITYTYDLAGNTLTALVPGAGTITNTFNSASRLSGSTTNYTVGGSPTTLISSPHYNALGQAISQSLGNGLNESWTYNDRGWQTGYNLANGPTSVYSYSLMQAPNGNVSSSNDAVNGNWVYGYDDFNRLNYSTVTGMRYRSAEQSYTYVYDRFGNRWQQNVTVGTGDTSSLAFDANNHITTTGVTYDAAGDVTNDGTNSYAYDAEGRISSVNSGAATYAYDAEGRRAFLVDSHTGQVCYYFDLQDHVVFQASCNNGRMRMEYYVQGRHLVTYSATTFFNYPNWLGTVQFQTTPTGAPYGYAINNPFGDNLYDAEGASPFNFTGKERDNGDPSNLTNLDDFGARFYANFMARFMTPDPLLNSGRPWDPQSWNRYAYARNNPLLNTDPTGLYDIACGTDKACKSHAKDLKNGLADLQKRVDKMKDGAAKQRLEASLKALGTEGDNNGVSVAFGKIQNPSSSDAAGGFDVRVDPITNEATATITLDPSRTGDEDSYAINAVHEGTHLEDWLTGAVDAMNPTPSFPELSDFSKEYRGYQTSAYAAQALGLPHLQYKNYEIWNPRWGIIDQNLTQFITHTYHEPNGQPFQETTPHNPWNN